jgi:transposase
METTVFVAREIKFDRKSQPEVLADIERLKKAGFSVFFGEGKSPPDSEPVRAKPASPTAEGVREVVDSIRDRHGIGRSAIAALVGVSGGAIDHWITGRNGISDSAWSRLARLKRRSDRLEPQDEVLLAEARGALRGRRLYRGLAQAKSRTAATGKGVRIGDDVRLQVAILRLEEGRSFRSIANQFGISNSTVRCIVREFESSRA